MGKETLYVEGVSLIVIGCEGIEGMLGDVVFLRQEGPNAPELEDALAAVQDRQLVDAHELFAELLVVQAVRNLPAPALPCVVGIHRFFSQGGGKLL